MVTYKMLNKSAAEVPNVYLYPRLTKMQHFGVERALRSSSPCMTSFAISLANSSLVFAKRPLVLHLIYLIPFIGTPQMSLYLSSSFSLFVLILLPLSSYFYGHSYPGVMCRRLLSHTQESLCLR